MYPYLEQTSLSAYIAGLYLGVMLVVLIVADIFYVSYCFTLKRFPFMWPLPTLRVMCTLSQSILFFPLIGLFLSILQCNEQRTHYVFEQLECWQGIHVLYAISGLSAAIVLSIISFFTTLVYFENRVMSGNVFAKVNARAELLNHILKVVTMMFFTVLGSSSFQWTLTIVLLLGSFVAYLAFQNTDVYISDKVQALWKVYSGLYFWTCFVLFLTKLLEHTEYAGGIFN